MVFRVRLFLPIEITMLIFKLFFSHFNRLKTFETPYFIDTLEFIYM